MNYIILFILWISFCIIHSALITTTFTNFLKRKLGKLFRFYRLFYNFIGMITIIPAIIYSYKIHEAPFITWSGVLILVRYILDLTGLFVFILGFLKYNKSLLIGIQQLKEGSENKSEALCSTGILGLIRHPFYTGTFLILWARDIDITSLITNVILTLYLVVGTLLEERKLILELGEQYIAYQQKVSMFFPIKWLRRKFR